MQDKINAFFKIFTLKKEVLLLPWFFKEIETKI